MREQNARSRRVTPERGSAILKKMAGKKQVKGLFFSLFVTRNKI